MVRRESIFHVIRVPIGGKSSFCGEKILFCKYFAGLRVRNRSWPKGEKYYCQFFFFCTTNYYSRIPTVYYWITNGWRFELYVVRSSALIWEKLLSMTNGRWLKGFLQSNFSDVRYFLPFFPASNFKVNKREWKNCFWEQIEFCALIA